MVRCSVSGWVSLLVTELAIVMDRPSRTQAVPSPRTRRVWNGDQRSRSRPSRGSCCGSAAVVSGGGRQLGPPDPWMTVPAASQIGMPRVLGTGRRAGTRSVSPNSVNKRPARPCAESGREHAQPGQHDGTAEHGPEAADVVHGDAHADHRDAQACVGEHEIGRDHLGAGSGRRQPVGGGQAPDDQSAEALPATTAPTRNSARDAADIPATTSASPTRKSPSPPSRTGLLLNGARPSAATAPAAKKRNGTPPRPRRGDEAA